MDYRRLGNSGTVVSTLCLGTMTFGNEADEATSFRIMDDYAAAGGTFLDTADIYSNGLSEEIIGRWMLSRPTDARQMVLTTKARFPMPPNGPNDIGLSRRYLSRALDESLTRMGVEQIDLFQMHSWDALTPVEETLRFLDDAVKAGKICYYGFSNYVGWQITKNAHIARANGWTAPVSLQSQYNLLVRDLEHEVIPACLDAGVGLLPYSPLASGWLSGKYRRDVLPPKGTRVGENPNKGMEAFDRRNGDERTWQVLDAVNGIAAKRGATTAQVSLAWLLAQPIVTSVVIGARNSDQLADNLGAAGLVLDNEELALLDKASSPRTDEYPYGPIGVWQRQRKIAGGL